MKKRSLGYSAALLSVVGSFVPIAMFLPGGGHMSVYSNIQRRGVGESISCLTVFSNSNMAAQLFVGNVTCLHYYIIATLLPVGSIATLH